jgi:hypothetical protein
MRMKPGRMQKIKDAIARYKAKKAQFEKEKDDKSQNFEDGKDGGGDGGGDGGKTGGDAKAVIKMINDGSISIADFDEIEAAMASARKGAEPEAEIAPAAAPSEVMSKKTPKQSMSAREAKLQGRIEALEADNATRKDEKSAEEDVAAAYERLKDRPLGADLRERLVVFRKTHGKEAFQAYTDSLAQTTGVIPSDDPAAENFDGQDVNIDDVAMKYHDKGAEAVESAQKFCKQHEQLANSNSGIKMSRERYVELNMAREAQRSN